MGGHLPRVNITEGEEPEHAADRLKCILDVSLPPMTAFSP